MARTPLSLAGLAVAALPGTSIVGMRGIEQPGDYDSAELTCSDGSTLLVQTPASELAGVSQAAELALLLAELQHLVLAGELPFAVPEVVATTPLPDQAWGKAVITRALVGNPLQVDAMRPGPGLTYNVGRAIAAIHSLPTALLERLEFPIFTAADYRNRHLIELDAAGSTGLVPTVLLERWEDYLEDEDIWQFTPVVLHGDLAAEYLLVDKGRVSTVSGWANARVADPADDLSWLVAAASDEVGESLLKAYQSSRPGVEDPGLLDRAMLLSELALARWLQYGLRENQPDIVSEATTMLSDLAQAVS